MIIHDVAQGSDEWFALRAGIPTASEFAKLVTSTGTPSKSLGGYARTLAGEAYAGKPLDPWEGNRHTERGKELEEPALDLYGFANGVSVEKVGFVMDDAKTMGCSPDGLIGDDGMAEIKCLKMENHIKTIMDYQDRRKTPPDYIQQTQGQMMICERQWCDLVFYHPDLPMLVIRQHPDLHIQDAIRAGIADVTAQRDICLAALNAQAGDGAPPEAAPVSVDLSTAQPAF